MKILIIALSLCSLATLSLGCSESKCEKYAKLEWECSDYPESEKDMTILLSKGMCDVANSNGDEARGVKELLGNEIKCAEKATDCSSYNACKNSEKNSE